MYLICAGLSLIVSALSIYFGNGYLPPDLGKLSRLFSILGVFQRLSWVLLRLIHLILLLLIIIVAFSVMVPPKCLADGKSMQPLQI